ncbi:MAG: ABC transporter permease [Candidatus Woesearchaeota archaeon]
MISSETLVYAFDNLKGRKMRSFLTILSIFVGITTIFVFVSFGMGLYNYIEDISSEMGVDKVLLQARGIGVPGTDTSFRLTDDDLNTFSKVRGIQHAVGLKFTSVIVEQDTGISYHYAVSLPVHDRESYDIAVEFMTLTIDRGRHLIRGDSHRVILGSSYRVPNRIFDRPLDVNDRIIVNGHTLRVVGFFDALGNPEDDGNIYMDEQTYATVVGDEDPPYAMIIGVVDNVDQMDEIIDRATRRLRQTRGLEEGREDFFIQSFEDLIESFQRSLDVIVYFVVFIAFLSVLISAINTANTMFTSILERTKEIGVLKSIGATNGQIMTVFLIESSTLGLIAGIIGASLGVGLSYIAGVVLQSIGFGFLQPALSWELFLGCVLFATLVGTISGLIPAYNASRKNPVDALRYE